MIDVWDRYDATGRTDDLSFGDAEEMGWDAYFESVYQRVDRKILDDHKKSYQGTSSFSTLHLKYPFSTCSTPSIP